MNQPMTLPICHEAMRPILETGPLIPRANGHAAKLERAKAWLGKRWVCHEVNRVKKLAEPLPALFVWKPRVLKGRRA